MELNKILIVAIILITATANVTIGAGLGIPVEAKQSAASSGYNHGQQDCDDIKDGVPQNQVYYFKPQYGPDMHTAIFNQAYVSGWSDAGCAAQELNDRLYPEIFTDDVQVNTAIDNSNFDDHSVSQPQQQTATTVQSNSCPQLIVNGNCITGQEQSTTNTFGQANRND